MNNVPKYHEMYNGFLECLIDKDEHFIHEIRDSLSKKLNLSEEELNLTLKSGHNLFFNRVGWTGTYLKKAGLVSSVKRGVFKITSDGLKLLNEDIRITNDVLSRYETFIEFKNYNTKELKNDIKKEQTIDSQTPQELIESAIEEINRTLEEDVLNEILKHDFSFLERISVHLLINMGYGKTENSWVTQKTREHGIDGVILEDELGINSIMVQAKRYDRDNKVGEPEIQKFAGALLKQKNVKRGVFITTSSFTNDAIKYANGANIGIILIDGEKLGQLMIKYNVGCSVDNIYQVKSLDMDFFEEE